MGDDIRARRAAGDRYSPRYSPRYAPRDTCEGTLNRPRLHLGEYLGVSAQVIPMQDGTFHRPADWGQNTILTDFIFFRSAAPGANKLAPNVQERGDRCA